MAISLVLDVLRLMRSVLSDEKKLSIAALSQIIPERSSTDDAVICYQPLELLAECIGCGNPNDAAARRADSPLGRHHQRIGDEPSGHRRTHRPAHDLRTD